MLKTYQANHSDRNPGIACIQVLVPDEYISAKDLRRALAVYSLENAPLAGGAPDKHDRCFHFMLFDWLRTLKQLLDNRKIPYTVTRRFHLPDIHGIDKVNHFERAILHSGTMVLDKTTI